MLWNALLYARVINLSIKHLASYNERWLLLVITSARHLSMIQNSTPRLSSIFDFERMHAVGDPVRISYFNGSI